MSKSLSWVRCFLWTAFLHSCSTTKGPRVKKYLNSNCACQDQSGEIYNLERLQSTDGNASFTVKGETYTGNWYYSYNPCSSFKLSGCQKDAAVCRWVPGQGPDAYETIGQHRKVTCKWDGETNAPMLVYKSEKFNNRSATVKLKCDITKTDKDEAIFEVKDEDVWIFQLTHKCGCGDGCPIDPVTPTNAKRVGRVGPTPDPFDPTRIIYPVASSAGTAVIILVVWWCLKRRNNDDGNNERQNLLGDGAGDQYENVIAHPVEESNSGRHSRPAPVGFSRDKADFNARSTNV